MELSNSIRLPLILCVFFFCWFAQAIYADDSANLSYKLDTDDKLKVSVYNQEDLNGEYTIDGAGNISLPLIGTLSAKNLTVQELENRLKDKLSPDYLLNPKINIQVLNYRPYYIIGEVEKPDSYPYVSGMTYLNAVAIAGGFTYRAKENIVYVIRDNDPGQTEIEATMDMLVMPGDIIRVDERLF